ncbi:glycosyltransferase [Micrococcus sp. FDAARGOS_333]|uniref:glycosyltransferase n=1 Tax=Micrococcus sp. FDAARGOS_333 TaxID=1930558 RepID=UPI000B4E6AE0|nr:glycosyltransferase [Micrococcus sp. FDAARGOS_333]PNL17821.1 hypothetical protein CEQ11_006660 [Micrococcus sp. FDAARGOS_333]
MIQLFLRFSRRQQLVMGLFVLLALVGTVLAFIVDHTVLIIGLFWMLCAAVFVMIMYHRRLNAKITRFARARGAAVPGPRARKPASKGAAARLSSQESLETLRAAFERRGTVAAGLPLARKLIQEKGDISGAREVLDQIRDKSGLKEAEVGYIRRVDSLHRFLSEDVELPRRHRSYNYVPVRNKVMYAVGMSPVSVTNGYTSRTKGVVEGLTGQGLDVFVAPMPGKPWDKKTVQGGRRVPAEQRRYVEEIDDVRYVHNPGIPAWEGDIDIFFQVAADAYVREAMIEKPEYILAASNYLSALPALIAARRLGIPFVYEMRGFWEVSAASVREGWADSDQYRLDRRMEDLVAGSADRVVVITEEMRQDLIARGVDGDLVSVAPNCVDADTFAPLGKDTALLRSLGFSEPDLPVVGFAGSVTDYEGLDLVAEALATLKGRGTRFNFLVMGGGAYLDRLKALVSELGLDAETRFVSGVPNAKMPAYLSSIDVFPLARKSLPVTELVSPLKPLEAMAVGGAVVLSDVSPHTVFCGPDQATALSFAKDDVASLVDRLAEVLEDREAARAMGVRARRWVKENRSWSVTGARIAEALGSLSRDGRTAGADAEAERPLKDFTVAFIGDVFTSDTFVPELTALRVRPDDWNEQFQTHSVDALFIESAWQGNDGAWTGIIGYYDDETHAPIAELIAHCRQHGIPVMFWNKEDPVHYNRFKRTASLCDYVFTTDARTIVDYKSLPDNQIKTVASAPFAAQPLLHNPLPSTREQDESIAYGGTYYGDKYATRKQGLDFLFYESAPFGLAIYERVHNDPNSPYRLPDRFRRYARQSLSYPDMCQAYKAHPIHLNGNSVVDSPSMFSRRVVEITASGSTVLSSAGRGVDETLAGTVPTVTTADQANGHLEAWKDSEALRHEGLWKAFRHVYEAHTCAHRLVYMMRVAGFRVQSPATAPVAVECSRADVPLFEAQTVRPALYLLTDSTDGVQASCPVVHAEGEARVAALREAGIGHVVVHRAGAPAPEAHLLEDMSLALRFGDWKAVGTRTVAWGKGEPHVRIAALTSDIEPGTVLLAEDVYEAWLQGSPPALDDEQVFAWQRVVDRDGSAQASGGTAAEVVSGTPSSPVGAGAAAAGASGVPASAGLPDGSQDVAGAVMVGEETTQPLTVLVAGHDLKFFPQITAVLERAGHRVIVDQWGGHDIHDEQQSRRLLAEADVVFCEWALGNVKWYSRNKREGQRLIVRLHAQELRTRFLREADLKAVDTFVFVSPVGMRRAQITFGVPAERSVVIGNTFDVDAFAAPRTDPDPHVLGMVGSVPQSKRLDLALDVMERLTAEDPDYRLVVKGKEYMEYPWLMNREPEREYFEAQYARLTDSPALQGAVEFGGHSADIAEWYRTEPGFILSTSDHEGTHQAIAEGGAAGCVPIIWPWAGAEFVYGERWLVEDAAEAVDRVRRLTADRDRFLQESAEVREFMRSHFAPATIGAQILEVVEGRRR